MKDVSVLHKAYELEPDKPETYYGFISHQEFIGKYKETKQFCQKPHESKAGP